MNHTEYSKLDAVALAQLVQSGQVTPLELMQVSIDLAQQADEKLHFLCHPKFEESLELAKTYQGGGAFAGIPFLLKDSGLASKRFPSSLGSQLFKDTSFTFNSTLVDRFEKAGLISYARTLVPEFCMAPTSEATVYPHPSVNPWDVSRSSGGSSGGAAAAVAAGVVPVAHGSDGGGSIRIPAACCGIYGLKASRGVVPMGPTRGEGWGGLAVDGVLTRTVRDTALAMDAIGGMEPGNPYAAPQFATSFVDAIGTDKRRKLRLGVWRTTFDGTPLSEPVLAGLEKTVAICKSLGHEVVDLQTPQFDYAGFVKAHAHILMANIVNSVDTKLGMLGRKLQDNDLEHAIYSGYEYGKDLRGDEYIRAINTLHQISRLMSQWMQGFDLMITPALNDLPAKLGFISMREDFWALRKKASQYSSFFAIVNASGQPAASLPTHWTEEGVPVATQIIGHFGTDDLVLNLSAQIEETGYWYTQQHRYHV